MSKSEGTNGSQTPHDTEKITALCRLLLEQYGAEKTGIGYESNFVLSVFYGTDEVLNDVEKNPDRYREYGNIPGVERSLAMLLALLHDIGLTVCREGHNDIGLGVVKGDLSITDILKVPVFSDRLKEGHLSRQEREHLIMLADGRVKCSDLTVEEMIGLSVILARCMRFYLGYMGSVPGGNGFYEVNTEWIFEGFVNYFPFIDDVDIIRNAADSLFENGRFTVSTNHSDLQEITKELHEILTEDERKTFADAVQDHSFSVDEEGAPYFCRNLYGKVLAETIARQKKYVQMFASDTNRGLSKTGTLLD